MIVLDASVFGKLLVIEPDRGEAEALIDHCIRRDVPLLAPTLIVYESLSIALRHGVPFQEVITLIANVRRGGLAIEEPSPGELIMSQEIATFGTRAAGYPELADSIYHAMAIERGGTFVTADKRHVAKAKQFGHITLLSEWRPG